MPAIQVPLFILISPKGTTRKNEGHHIYRYSPNGENREVQVEPTSPSLEYQPQTPLDRSNQTNMIRLGRNNKDEKGHKQLGI